MRLWKQLTGDGPWPRRRCDEFTRGFRPKAPLCIAAAALVLLNSCAKVQGEAGHSSQSPQGPEVGVVRVARKDLRRQLPVASELIPFQQIDVYAKEAGFVRDLRVDYGTHVKAGQTMAVLEIPELRIQLDEDDAAIKDAGDQVARGKNELERVQAQHKVADLEFTRLNEVAKSRPGLVALQEVEDTHGKDLAAEAQVQASQSAVASAESQLSRAEAKRRHDQAIFDYSRITAPFDGVVTKRYANQGTLMQSGIESSTAMPLVQLSEDACSGW